MRAEEGGYFHTEHQQEQGTNGPVVKVVKHMFYGDVYIFVVSLKDLAATRLKDVKRVNTTCLRGSALMWYSAELTGTERNLLRDSDLDR